MSFSQRMTFSHKISHINWGFVGVVALVALIGISTLYAAAGGHWQPWALKQSMYFLVGFAVMFGVAVIDIQILFRYSYVFYALMLICLVVVGMFGVVGLGARRWINLGFFHFQPSEFMRVAVIMALARYFQGLGYEDIGSVKKLIIPILMVILPFALVIKQPDLGTALMILLGGGIIFFLAGVRWWKFAIVIVIVCAAVPVVWHHLHAYQKERISIFLNPGKDPSGAGYHILQSEISLGSGGFSGKGFLKATQGNLDFLPEKHTDFILPLFAEQYGFVGTVLLLFLYASLIYMGFRIAIECRSYFSRLLSMGLTVAFALYVFTNASMVVGFMPVVGVPLPLMSYGGTVSITVMGIFGLLLNMSIHRDVRFQGR